MKKNFIITCMLILSCTAFGQQIKNKNVEFEDLTTLLSFAGYELFSYDISEMLNERYNITITLKEYEAGKEIASTNRATVPNKRLLADFPESERQRIIDEGRVVLHAKKISFGFYPSDNDSTKRMLVSVPGFMEGGGVLKLRGLPQKDSDKLFYFYTTRPFQIKAFKEDEFIPLVLVSSGWYDEQFGIFRSCGQREIEPEMSDETYRNIPHHYIVGVTFVKRE